MPIAILEMGQFKAELTVPTANPLMAMPFRTAGVYPYEEGKPVQYFAVFRLKAQEDGKFLYRWESIITEEGMPKLMKYAELVKAGKAK